ncbi:MAG TPA: hypothetical protein VKF80_05410 [Candidatus Eisenbacteria bacterium]|nr:hypothetical protein [Candidatus Eisenbacteria bacterium]
MRRNATLLFLLVFLTRVPFLGPGFGSDPDAWRIAGAARDIGRTGHYEASRFPGAPVVEIVDSLLLRLGERALPIASALWGAIACAAFYVALCRLGARGCFWAALALAFTPVFWIHTTDAMDYSWALGLAMLALAFAVYGRAVLAGTALGLAIGCRITTAVLILPIAILLEGRSYSRLVLSTILFGALALAPSFLTYGTRFLSGYEFGRVPWIYVIKGATRDVWGVIGSLAIAIALVIGLFRLRLAPRRELLAVVIAVALTGSIYFRLPHEGAYLLPAVPFVLLFLTRTLAKPGAVALACAMLASSILLGVSEVSTSADRHLSVEVRGSLLKECERRAEQLAARDALLKRAASLPPNATVLVYEQLPLVEWAAPKGSPGFPEFVHLLPPAALILAKEENRPVYATEQALDGEQKIYRVDAEKEWGVEKIP